MLLLFLSSWGILFAQDSNRAPVKNVVYGADLIHVDRPRFAAVDQKGNAKVNEPFMVSTEIGRVLCGITYQTCSKNGCGTAANPGSCCNFLTHGVCLPCKMIFDPFQCKTFPNDCTGGCLACNEGYHPINGRCECKPRQLVNKCVRGTCAMTCPHTMDTDTPALMFCRNGMSCLATNAEKAAFGWGCCNSEQSGGVLECPLSFPFLCESGSHCVDSSSTCTGAGGVVTGTCGDYNKLNCEVDHRSCSDVPSKCIKLVERVTSTSYTTACPVPLFSLKCPIKPAPSCEPREPQISCTEDTVSGTGCAFACPHTTASHYVCRDNKTAIWASGCSAGGGILECNAEAPFSCASFRCVRSNAECTNAETTLVDSVFAYCTEEGSNTLCIAQTFCVDAPRKCTDNSYHLLVGHPGNKVPLKCPIPLEDFACPLPAARVGSANCAPPALVNISTGGYTVSGCPFNNGTSALCRNKKLSSAAGCNEVDWGGILRCPRGTPLLCTGQVRCVSTAFKCDIVAGEVMNGAGNDTCPNGKSQVACRLPSSCVETASQCTTTLDQDCPVPLPGLNCLEVKTTTTTATTFTPNVTSTTTNATNATMAGAEKAVIVGGLGTTAIVLLALLGALVAALLLGACCWVCIVTVARREEDEWEEDEWEEGEGEGDGVERRRARELKKRLEVHTSEFLEHDIEETEFGRSGPQE
eukprot:GEMP01014765.1.p1 GENE.GEMP01014765.1~~GEMP01014765.1.p1  ORF type:complete len:695 (+),score=124.51 GEMP01014765.1:360-2444(+)